jgi:hypothetical protein
MSFFSSVQGGAVLVAGALAGLFGSGHSLASTTPPVAHHPMVNATCIGAAVSARESALDAGISTYTSAISADYVNRASGLQSDYALASTTQIRTAVKSTWSTFDTTGVTARTTWKTTQKNAWTAFSTAAKACGASGEAVSDVSNESADAQMTTGS